MIKNDALKAQLIAAMRTAAKGREWNQEAHCLFWVGQAAECAKAAYASMYGDEIPEGECSRFRERFIKAFLPLAICEGVGFGNASQARQVIFPEAKATSCKRNAVEAYLASMGITAPAVTKPVVSNMEPSVSSSSKTCTMGRGATKWTRYFRRLPLLFQRSITPKAVCNDGGTINVSQACMTQTSTLVPIPYLKPSRV
jgi:hypothetical protein